MVELQKGIACVLGSAIVRDLYYRLLMPDFVYGCSPNNSQKAHSLRIVNEIAESDVLLETAIQVAERFANYPSIPFATTKSFINASIIDMMRINSRALRIQRALLLTRQMSIFVRFLEQ